jgi:hypothetical protein
MSADLTQAPVGLADTATEDEAATGTAFAFFQNESMGKERALGGAQCGLEAGLPRMRPAGSPLRPVEPAMPLLTLREEKNHVHDARRDEDRPLDEGRAVLRVQQGGQPGRRPDQQGAVCRFPGPPARGGPDPDHPVRRERAAPLPGPGHQPCAVRQLHPHPGGRVPRDAAQRHVGGLLRDPGPRPDSPPERRIQDAGLHTYLRSLDIRFFHPNHRSFISLKA